MDRLPPGDRQVDDLAIVRVGASMLERVQERLLDVVNVAALVGRINLNVHRQRADQGFDPTGRQNGDDPLAEAQALPADQRSRLRAASSG